MHDDLIPTAEVARLVHKTVATVNRWANEGKLPPAVVMPGETGARLFRRSDVEAFLADLEPSEAAS